MCPCRQCLLDFRHSCECVCPHTCVYVHGVCTHVRGFVRASPQVGWEGSKW